MFVCDKLISTMMIQTILSQTVGWAIMIMLHQYTTDELRKVGNLQV